MISIASFASCITMRRNFVVFSHGARRVRKKCSRFDRDAQATDGKGCDEGRAKIAFRNGDYDGLQNFGYMHIAQVGFAKDDRAVIGTFICQYHTLMQHSLAALHQGES